MSAAPAVLTFQIGAGHPDADVLPAGARLPPTEDWYTLPQARQLFEALGIDPLSWRARLWLVPEGSGVALVAYDLGSALTTIPGPREPITINAPMVAVEFPS